MMLRVLRCVTLSLLAAALFPESGRAAVEGPHIHVFSCQVVSGILVPQTDEIGLAVRFENDSPAEYSSIVWRAKYGTRAIDFIDDGTFTPNVQIDNYVLFERGTTHFNVGAALLDVAAVAVHAPPSQDMWSSNMVFGLYVGTEDPENCSIVRITAVNGDVWENSALPQSVPNIPPPQPVASPSPAPEPTPPKDPSIDPIEITQCILGINTVHAHRADLVVSFRNRSTALADTVVFRANYEQSGLDFTDHGSFSRDVSIRHDVRLAVADGIATRLYFGFNDPAACSVVSVHYADAPPWQNPFLATTAPLPTPIPNALSLIKMKPAKWQRHAVPTPMPTSSGSASSAPGTPR